MVEARSPSLTSWGLAALIACAGCGGDESDPCGDGGCGGATATEPCPAPNRWVGEDRCLPPGVQDNGCAAGEYDPGDGTCQPAGIPPELCGTGFEPTDEGCTPVLPDDPCPSGTMALPGETACRPVAPCGTGAWGDIPVEPSTVYVDTGYTGGASNGSATSPFVTIGEAIDAATPGAIVAVAAGSYPESLEITKPVRLWGTCPDQVEVVGAAPDDRVIFIRPGGAGTEIRSLALTGARVGLLISGVTEIVAAELWVHDLAEIGIDIESPLGPTDAAVSDTLIEQVHDLGIFVMDANLTVERSAVRDTQPVGGVWGRGIHIEHDNVAKDRPVVQIAEVLVERNHEMGLFAGGGDVTIVDSVVRDTLPRPTTQGDGWGVALREAVDFPSPSRGVLRGLYVAGNHEVGVTINGSEVTAEALTIRATKPHALTEEHGLGLQIMAGDTDLPSRVAMEAAVIEDNHFLGLLIRDSEVVLEGILVRNNQAQRSDSLAGRGVDLGNTLSADPPPAVTLTGNRIEANHDVGLLVMDCEATVLGNAVRNTAPQLSDGSGGAGIVVQLGGRALVAGSLVEHNSDAGVFAFSGDATVFGTVVNATESTAGLFGDGVIVVAGGSFELSHSLVSHCARAGVGAWAAAGSLANNQLECNSIDLNVDPYDGQYGTLTDLGGNRCGCEGATRACKALSSGIEPPTPPQP